MPSRWRWNQHSTCARARARVRASYRSPLRPEVSLFRKLKAPAFSFPSFSFFFFFFFFFFSSSSPPSLFLLPCNCRRRRRRKLYGDGRPSKMPSGSRSARQGPQPAATSVPDCPAKSRPVEQRRQVLSRRTVGDRPAVSREPRNGANRRSFESAERNPTEEKRNVRRRGSKGS